MESGLSGIFVLTHDTDPKRLAATKRTLHQGEDQINVMNHQIQDDADIGRTKGICAGPFAPQIFWSGDHFFCGLKGGIEPFDVTDLQ